MNKEVLKSWLFKLLPIVLAFVVGKGWIAQQDADQIVPLLDRVMLAVDEVLLLAASVATLFRSVKTHNQKPS